MASVSDSQSGPLARVTGSRAVIGRDFIQTLEEDGFVVDKSLLCKALLDAGLEAMRICLPPRFGKTFNLSVIAEFFNVVTTHDVRRSPDAGSLAEARTWRRGMFHGSLLEQSDKNGNGCGDGPFFVRHFAKHPVIRIDFKEVTGSTVGKFYMSLARALLESADYWITAYDRPELVKPSAQSEYEALCKTYQAFRSRLTGGDDMWEQHGLAAPLVFKALDKFLAAQHQSRYVVLVDEYDTPLTAILGKAWHEVAQSHYAALLSKILKTNSSLLFGLLVGVNEFNLADCDPCVNNVARIEVTAGRFNPTPENPWHRPEDRDEDRVASLFAFAREEVIELVDRACESHAALRKHPQDPILEAIAEWYDGYDFGFADMRYNPLSVMSFLKRLAQDPRNLVGQPFWEETGNPQRIEDLARSHPADFLLLATKLVAGFDSGAGHTGLRAVGVHRREWVAPQDDDAIDVTISSSTYADSSGNIVGFTSLVTMMLHLGYIAVQAGNTLRIPNRELRAMWGRLRVLAAFGAMDPSEVAWTRQRLVSNLYRGDVSGLLGFRTIIEKLANATNQYQVAHQADVLGAFLMTMLSGYGGAGDAADQPQFTPERKGWRDTISMEALFEPSDRLPGGLVVLFNYKRVSTYGQGARNKLLAEARKGLEEIVDQNNAAPYGNYARRLDISFGVDCSEVMVQQRLWVRVETPEDAGQPHDIEQPRQPAETVDDWGRRMAETDCCS